MTLVSAILQQERLLESLRGLRREQEPCKAKAQLHQSVGHCWVMTVTNVLTMKGALLWAASPLPPNLCQITNLNT